MKSFLDSYVDTFEITSWNVLHSSSNQAVFALRLISHSAGSLLLSIHHHLHLWSALMIRWRLGAAAGQQSFIRCMLAGKKPLFYQLTHEYLWLHIGRGVYSKLFQLCFSKRKCCSASLAKVMSVNMLLK